MTWVSTRRHAPPVPFIDALFAGTAPDGGLYMPERLEPLPDTRREAIRHAARSGNLVGIASQVGAHLLRDEITQAALRPLVAAALDFPVPLRQVSNRAWVLELFHGPTFAFKDIGARTQARLLHHFTDGTPLTILVATSGDTGSAVAQAFHRVPDTRVVVLYPKGKVSDVQEAQMAALGDNITALSIDGTFDDCQRMVKQAFADDALRKHVWLTPANSINLGRLLPQVFYYFLLAGLDTPPIVSVPSGNSGNLTAGLIAHRLGLPVKRFVAATNVNDAVPRYLLSGRYEPKASVATVANAMDVGAPSNFERMQFMYDGDVEALRRDVTGYAYDDAAVVKAIADVHRTHGYILDPHSAIGWLALEEELANDPGATGVFLATAHPSKFREVVEPAIGQAVPLPQPLAEALTRPRHSIEMAADYGALREFLAS
jgi:threonine synthase